MLIRRGKTIRNILLVFMLLLMIGDVALLVLHLRNYTAFFLSTSSITRFLFYHFMMMLLFSFSISRTKALFVMALTIVCCIVIGFMMCFVSNVADWHYEHFDSPNRTETLVIRYREATLGESNYFYEVYQRMNGILLKHLESEDFKVVVPYNGSFSGIQSVQWLDETDFKFEIQGVTKTISLK